MIGDKYVSSIVAFPFKIFLWVLMLMGRIGARLYLFIYRNDKMKSERIKEYIEEGPLRYTSGFNYVAQNNYGILFIIRL
jgi:hypothetical protein